ncbi:MAG: hypothetical protein IPK10_02000 [Bacteroidetes bacterium]|nr:hypothetical protein [Bacteroidota bacterium]
MQLKEESGKGISGFVDGVYLQLGSRSYLGLASDQFSSKKTSEVVVSIDGKFYGAFHFETSYRNSSTSLLQKLKKDGYQISIVSGDYNFEQSHLQKILNQKEGLLFEQKPIDKLNAIKEKQNCGKK